MKRKKPRRAKMVQKGQRLPTSRSTIDLLNLMPITGYMKFNLDSADCNELFEQTVECTGDFADPIRRGYILGSPHYYKFTVVLCNYSGMILSENDYFIIDMIDHHGFEQVIREFVNEQAGEFGHRKVISGRHSTIQLSVYNPNTKEHL